MAVDEDLLSWVSWTKNEIWQREESVVYKYIWSGICISLMNISDIYKIIYIYTHYSMCISIYVYHVYLQPGPRKQKIDTTTPQTLNDIVGTLSRIFKPLKGRNFLVPLILQLHWSSGINSVALSEISPPWCFLDQRFSSFRHALQWWVMHLRFMNILYIIDQNSIQYICTYKYKCDMICKFKYV